MTRQKFLRAIAACSVLFVAAPGVADEVADFYRGKKIKMVMPTSHGGATALYGIVLGEHLKGHIPGKPNIIHEYRTGSGGLIAANYVFNAAPKDGSVITMLLSSTVLTQQIKPKAAKFSVDKFSIIGRISDSPRALIAWHTAGINSIEDAKKHSIPLGASGRTSVTTIHPVLINRFFGTKFKIVTGYRGAGNTYLALERGEISATTVAWDGLISNRGDWLKSGKVKLLAIIGARKLPGFESVPRIIDFGRNAEEKAVLNLTLLPSELGQTVAAPPGIPAARFAALRKAFDATVRDPAFLAAAKKRKMNLEPRNGEWLKAMIVKGMKQPEAVIDRARALIRAGGKQTSKRMKKKK
jgi:tripartite-type tricarboxylate transporter receptor subunit TctC